jgi:hypothetical protein
MPFGGLPKARHHIQQCRFAAARVADDADKFPFLNGEVDAIQHHILPGGGGVDLREIVDHQEGFLGQAFGWGLGE